MIIIPIQSKKYGLKHFFIDGEDFEKVKNYKWCISKGWNDDDFYVVTNLKTKPRGLILHRYLMDCPKNMIVDHINHNTLDNRKENMRVCTKAQNGMNQKKQKRKTFSKYKGVVFYKKGNYTCFHAQIMIGQKHKSLGYHKTEELAAIAYNVGAVKYFGEFALLNIIDIEILIKNLTNSTI